MRRAPGAGARGTRCGSISLVGGGGGGVAGGQVGSGVGGGGGGVAGGHDGERGQVEG